LNGKDSGSKLREVGRILEVVQLKSLYSAQAITVEYLTGKQFKTN